MRVLFVYPDISFFMGQFNQGIGYLSAVLKKAGHHPSLLHIESDVSPKWLLPRVKKAGPDLIAISATTHQFPYARKYAGWIKQRFPIPIICGGIHATLVPEEVIATEAIDMVCVGEGEYPLLELVESLESGRDVTKIRNLWVKQDGAIHRNPLRPLLHDLTELPVPDRELFDFPRLLHRRGGMADIVAGRGCPYNCTYCCNHALRSLYAGQGKFIRQRSVPHVIEEVQHIVSQYRVKKINFDDDTFTLNVNWLTEFRQHWPREIGLPFWCNGRVENLSREVLAMLKEAGCEELRIGVESGSELLRHQVLRRTMSNEQIRATFATAHELGLKTFAFYMIGVPFETPEMVEETIALNREINPTSFQVSAFYPYPGTNLYSVSQEHGFLTPADKDDWLSEEGSTLNLPTLSDKQIRRYQRLMWELKLKKELEARRLLRPFFSALRAALGERRVLQLANLVRRRLPNLTWFLRRLD